MSAIPNWFVTQWDTAVRTEVGQKDSRFMGAVTDRGTISGEAFTIDFLADDGSKLKQDTTRYGDTEWTLGDQSARLVSMYDYFDAMPLSRADIPKMLVNPVTGGDYMRLMQARRNRRVDDIIYSAARATISRKDGSTVALPSSQKIAHGSTGFTKAKLITTKKLFRKNEADEYNGEDLYLAYNSEMLEDILTDTTLTNSDFMSVKMLQDGGLSKKWMGFTWVPYEGLEFTASTYYTIAWAKSAIHFGRGFEEGNVTRRGDKKDAYQVSMAASYGAGRQDEKKVVEIAFQ